MQVRREAKSVPRIPDALWRRVETWLRDEWSPGQIADWLYRREGLHLSHEWIYQYVLKDKASGGDLYRHLRCQKRRRKRYGCYQRRGPFGQSGLD